MAVSAGYCPTENASGIIQLTMPLTATTVAAITANEAPFIMSFAARRTTPARIDGRIDEGADNTITYKGNKYTLTGGIQICRQSHTGYALPDQQTTASAELYMPFVNPRVTGAYPMTVVLVIPIYQASVADHASYLKQLVDSSAPVASLQTVFLDNVGDGSQTSFGYQTCVDLSGTAAKNTTIAFFYFPRGVTLTGQDFAALVRTPASLPDFRLPPAGREALDTVRDFNLVGTVREAVPSPEGILRKTQISSGSEEFTNRFIYYAKPPRLGGKFSEENCPYYKTSQYKCVPFDRLADLSGDYVIPGGTQVLKSLLSKEDALEAQARGEAISDGGASDSPPADAATIGGIIGGVLGGLVVLGAAVWGIGKLVSDDDEEGGVPSISINPTRK